MTTETEITESTETVTEAPNYFDMSPTELAEHSLETTEVEIEDETVELAEVTPVTKEEETEETVIDENSSITEEIETENSDETKIEEETSETKTESETSTVDFEAGYVKFMAPFKANGKEIKLDSVEEGIKLMQMGANYTKKMVELKPHLKVTKMLEKNGLLDTDKLNYLIDLSNKDPKAIAKLVKDSGIDPLDIDQESAKYTPKNYAVSDKEVNLDEVLGQIDSTPTYDRTLDIVGNQWDDSSKEILSANPKMIVDINDHMANGIFDKIDTELNKQRMFGGLQGLSSLQAYQKVGKELYDRGDFAISTATRAKPKDTQSEAVRNLKKRAASPTKAIQQKKAVSAKKPINYFDLSEEELLNLPKDKY